MILPQFQKNTYSEEDVARLCEIGGLHPKSLEDFRKSLEDSAAVCRWENAGSVDRPKSSVISRELKSVLNRIKRLGEAVEGLSDHAKWELDRGIGHSTDIDFRRFRKGDLAADAPTMMLIVNDAEDDFLALNLELEDLRKIIRRFEDATQQRIIDLPKRSPGQNRDWGLRIWMINMKSLWERTSDASFSRDVTSSNEPITNAARFCDAAFKYINPDCPTSLIMREMKLCIAESNRHTGQISAQNDH